ncbi:uncharacterized protein LOC122650731 [Telopea speciosissima]|uniref:uncharacterized protein LOC122650731 n=1 Tax=Telopea speciosissima TaxID=54955 RepID=UPI001CC3EFE5|nr:uncharacterized protein LOC122650731 [Telopea speciosissima]
MDQPQIRLYVEEYFKNFHRAVETTEHGELLNCTPRVLKEIDVFRLDLVPELANLMSFATRGGGMGLKIDIQKAYDTMSWDFIFKVLRKFGFSERWISWLHILLASTRISVLVNGGLEGFFSVERGLRQGDPISPMIFIIAEEVLCRGLTSLILERKVSPLRGPRGIQTPSHYLFVDDIFIFSDASRRWQAIVEELQIPVCNFPTRYLGVEIAKGRVKKNMLMLVMDRIRQKLTGWKGKLLSMAGRVELVKTVMSSMPIHSFSVY